MTASIPPIACTASGALQWPMPGEAADKADPRLMPALQPSKEYGIGRLGNTLSKLS
jgi:hypothetical protein